MPQQPAKFQPKLHNVPLPPTSFVGRVLELARLTDLVVEPECRLLTLVGVGGVGKTRLATQAAAELADDFTHGVYFVPLQLIDPTELIMTRLADVVNPSSPGRIESLDQLLDTLRNKEMLLVLDGFEHLLPSAAAPANNTQTQNIALLTRILETAPRVTLLITSRETLNLQGEWLFPLQGLAFPKSEQADDMEKYGAVQLFVERTRQIRPGFSLAQEQAGVARICRLVEGMPLALELAASWTKMLPCRDIAAKIEQNLEFLTSRLRDVPQRHRSIQAVFDQTWQILTEPEQEIFKRLSVFRDGFQPEAAETIAGASLPLLSGLVDKSLLYREPEKRYQMAELVRQYAAERLAEAPDVAVRVRAEHSAYYANFLHDREEDMLGGRRQREATAEIKTELENIRAAWQGAVSRIDIETIRKSFYALSLFYQFQSRYQEGAKILEQVVGRLDNAAPTKQRAETLAGVLVDLGWFYIRLGRLEQAEMVLKRSQAFYADYELLPSPGQATDPLIPLGIIATIQGNYDTAAKLGEAARRRSEAFNHQENLSFAFYVRTRAALALGNYEAAQAYAERAYDLVAESDDRYFMAYCLIELGNVALLRDQEAQAKQHYQKSYALRERFDDPEGMAIALTHLGKLALRQQDYAQAKQRYQDSLNLYRDIHDRGGRATALNGLGAVACATRDYQTAWQYFSDALQTAKAIEYVPLMLSILGGLGELLLQTRHTERGLELLAFVGHQSASDQEIKEKAHYLLARYKSDVSPEIYDRAIERGQQRDLETMTTNVLLEPPDLSSPVPPPKSTHTDTPAATPFLREPLTTRELEVLRLIAQGRTNQEIADELVIVEGTVKAHASNVYGKLNVANRTEAVAKAKELELLS